MGHIKRKHLSDSLVKIPDNKTFVRMNEIMDPIIEQIINFKIENRKLIKIRDTLIPKLMTGEVRV